jgi:hypothetical protein
MSKALASLDPSSSAGDGWCWKCLTCTLECHKNINFPQKIGPLHIHLHPPPRYYYIVATLQRLYALQAVLIQLD